MELSADKIERLIFVKYLLLQAEKQKDFERPNSSTAILTLHDLVECFLQLGLEHLTQKHRAQGNNILDFYCDEINKVLADKELQLINKSFIKRLNELRNQLKHSTIFIDIKNIRNLYAETDIFISDFSNILFDRSIESISLLNLIENVIIRDFLLSAESHINQNNYNKAVVDIGKSFYEYEQIAIKIKNRRGFPLINTNRSSTNYTRYHEHTMGAQKYDNNLRRGLQDVAKDIDEIKNDILDFKKILLLDVEIKKYFSFKDIMPYVSKIQSYKDGKHIYEYYIPGENNPKQFNFSYDQAKFCFDFVVETIFNSQNKKVHSKPLEVGEE